MAIDSVPGEHVRRHALVPAGLAGTRIDRAAAALFTEFSRATLSRWIASGALQVNGSAVKPSARLVGGERLQIDAWRLPREDWAAADTVPFEVIHEDDDLLVVDKPPGVVVHPGAGNPRGTLVNGLLALHPDLALLPRAGIVHRLDKDTSGLLLVARTARAQQALGRLIARRLVSRRYLAVVEGRLTTSLDLDQPIGRDPVRRTRQAVRPDGRPARTLVRVVERFRVHTLVEAVLETGRTHQIRVHLAAAGYPLVGDIRYGARRRVPPRARAVDLERIRGFPRQALHAWKLGLEHPFSGAPLELRSDLPNDLEALVGVLRGDASGHGG